MHTSRQLPKSVYFVSTGIKSVIKHATSLLICVYWLWMLSVLSICLSGMASPRPPTQSTNTKRHNAHPERKINAQHLKIIVKILACCSLLLHDCKLIDCPYKNKIEYWILDFLATAPHLFYFSSLWLLAQKGCCNNNTRIRCHANLFFILILSFLIIIHLNF